MQPNRPASFDARVMAYLPGLRRLALRYVPRRYADDLVTDTIIYALEKWQGYRESGGFWNWLTWCMRGVRSNQASAARTRDKYRSAALLAPYSDVVGPEGQENYTDLSATLARLSGIKNGDVVLRRAMGDKLDDIARERGVTRERVRQIEVAARAKLLEAA